MNKKSLFAKKVVAFITSFAFVASAAGISVALAALTFSGTSITMDNFVGLLGGVVGIGATSTSATLYVQSQGTATTTLLLQGLAGQSARLFAVASSSGVNSFEILNSGLASSTNFIAVNASTTNLDVSGYLTVVATSTLGSSTITGFTYGTASGTSLSASSYLNTPTLVAANASTSNVSSTNFTNATLFVSAGTSTFGGGSQIAKVFCGHSYANAGALAFNATGTVGITLTGISTSSAQAFNMGTNATGGMAYSLRLMNVVPSSTANAVDLVLQNISTSSLLSQSQLYSVCGIQQ